MGSEARTRLGLLGLLLVTLLSFGQVFGPGPWLGPAALGMAAAVVLVAAARRAGWSARWTTLASIAGLVWYLAIVFRMHDLFYGVPTLDALRGIWRAIAAAQAKSNIDYAPVPVRTGYVILTVIAMWFAAVIGEIATFRWRRPLVAVVPLVSLFSFLTIVGTRSGTTFLVLIFLSALLSYLALEASHRLRAWGSWVTSLADRRRETPIDVSSRLARRMGASCLAAALFAPAFLPAIGDGLLAWRSPAGGGAGTGGGSGGQIDLLASLQPRLIEQSDAEMFDVVADRAEYWRLTSLVNFDGITWRRLDEQPNVPLAQGHITGRYPVADPVLVDQEFTIRGLEGELLPAAVQPITADISTEVESRDDSDLRYEFEVGEIQLRSRLIEGVVYEVTSTVPQPTFRQLRDARPAQADPVYHDPGPIPISPEVDALARRWTRRARTPFTKLVALQDNLRLFAYSLDVPAAASTDHLSDFLLRTRRGYCQQFAAAFALLARNLGFATRVNVGFLPGETSLAQPDHFTVRGTDAHSWPEVLFEEHGWIRFEPTPGNNASPPRYTSRAVPFSAQNPFSDAATNGGAGNPGQIEANRQVPLGGRDRGGEVPTDQRRDASATPRWQETFSDILSFVILSVLVLIGAVPLIKMGRTWLRYRFATNAGAVTYAAFAEFEDEAGELATPRRVSESALAYARRVGAGYKVPRSEAIELATIYERSLYARDGIDDAQALRAHRLAKRLRRQLWSSSGSWDKARRLFSPRSLFAR